MRRDIKEVGAGLFILPGAQALVELTKSDKAQDVNFGAAPLTSGGLKIAPWGKDNLQPQQMLELIYNNHIKPQLITTARDFLLGSRVGCFKRSIKEGKIVVEPVIDTEMEDWFESIDGDAAMQSLAYNLEGFANYFSVLSLASKNYVEGIQSFDATVVRALVTTKPRPEKYALHHDWRNFKADEAKVLPAYDPRNPTKYGECLLHGRDWTPGQKYYDMPPYWGTRKWTEVSNKIPRFHSSGLDNGYNLKYHIKIPQGYFDQFGDAEKQKAAERDLMGAMNEMLAGVENADKAFVSKFAVDAMGKALPGWEIVPIENKMSDKAYDSVNTQANIAHTSGHGIDPSLAGIDTGGKFGGSGSEKRISYQLHIALRTPTKRKILLQTLKAAHAIMGFNRAHQFGFEDVDLTTLAENPTGQQKVANKSM
ncbi:hypothetical protein I2I05_18835 [Hymenobacter sp. BT683]|uniref:Phage portal protein n=1 Tax=Hymenobacter jeongseonensis TaxID=2791027 RepID=A0ABS0IMA3_9BACT|nr:hypothetical protein [Hymenobacter jeongseonensis]MBF9239456.1 hypothetical protein [Hymenobacter jeongseonensis]